MVTDHTLSPLHYALYGALCAAKWETGPNGARRMYRLQERLRIWNDDVVFAALCDLKELGMVREVEESIPGMVHIEAVWYTDSAITN